MSALSHLPSRSATIQDRLDLDELVSKYAWYVGQCSAEQIVDLFCEDGSFIGLDHQLHGRAALTAFFTRMLSRRSAIPLVTNKIFDIQGDLATGNATLLVLSGDSGLQTVCGYYDDEYVRLDGRWLFKSRRFSSYLSTMRIEVAAGAIGPTKKPAAAEPDRPRPSLDDFKSAMRRLAASVHVVTTIENGQRWGLTATAVASFSADPPAMIVCVNKAGHAYSPIIRSRRLGINLLAEDQRDIAERFSGATGERGDARFAGLHWSTECETPLLAGAVASFECTICDVAEYFTHAVLICQVDRIELNDSKRPLVYLDRSYSRVQEE